MSDNKVLLYADVTKGKKKSYCHRGNNNGATSKFEGETEELKDNTFTYGKKMGDKYLKSKEAFISYMGHKHGAREQQSLKKEA